MITQSRQGAEKGAGQVSYRWLCASAPRRAMLLAPRSAFTLMELLIVITIIAILSGLVLSGLASAVNDARVARTRSQIQKIDALIMERYESYRTRPVRVGTSANSIVAAQNRLSSIRELMRLELPDQIGDLCTNAERLDLESGDDSLNAITSLNDAKRAVLAIVPSVTCSYKRLAYRNSTSQGKAWTTANQGSECLYLILSTMKDGDKSALDYFTPDEIGDTDEDGMKEILDGFGRPIVFIRWAPGYSQMPGPDGAWGVQGTDDDGNGTADDIFEAGWPGSDDILPLTLQTRIGIKHPTLPGLEFASDPFDPLRVDPRLNDAVNTNDTFYLKPLLLSAGLDEEYDIAAAPAHDHAIVIAGHPANDPYYLGATVQPGTPINATGAWADNITNHFIEPQ